MLNDWKLLQDLYIRVSFITIFGIISRLFKTAYIHDLLKKYKGNFYSSKKEDFLFECIYIKKYLFSILIALLSLEVREFNGISIVLKVIFPRIRTYENTNILKIMWIILVMRALQPTNNCNFWHRTIFSPNYVNYYPDKTQNTSMINSWYQIIKNGCSHFGKSL